MERWHSTADTREAAAFASLGTEIRIQSSLFERTSQVDVRFLIAPASACGKWNTGKIRKALRARTLQRDEPAHPLLLFLRAYQNRARRLENLKDGKHFRPITVPGAPGTWQLEPTPDGLPGFTAGAAVVRTADLKLSAALDTTGFHCLTIRGNRGAEEFFHAAFLPEVPAPFNDASHLVTEWRRDTQALPWELPFTRAMHALTVLQNLHEQVKKSIHSVILTKSSTTHALVRADADSKAWDKAKIFLTGGR